jgi:ATP-dependent DNA helicase RecG
MDLYIYRWDDYILGMTTAAQRRQAALDAIDLVLAGTTAEDAETDLVDFKVEAGSVDRQGNRAVIPVQYEPVALALASEVACMANVPLGGVLVVGVADDQSGSAALVGAVSDPEWLRQRIWVHTRPGCSVDIEAIERDGVRLLLINVPDSFTEVRVGNRLRARLGTECVELDGERARRFLEERRGFDWSAQPSGMHLSEAEPEALVSARRHYQDENGIAPNSDHEIARRLGVLHDDADDPQLSNAGALLLCRFEPAHSKIQLIQTLAEGTAGDLFGRDRSPILPLFDGIVDELLTKSFPAESRLIGTQRQALRAIPETAIREAIVNAIMHRDYRLDRATTLILALGQPAASLKVRSPGGLLPGISAGRLIAARSQSRNPALADAMRVLGLAERQGVGIDTMYRLMLRDGHPEPEIVEQDGDVIVRLTGGQPDVRTRSFFSDLTAKDPSLDQDVRSAIAIDRLLKQRSLRPRDLAEAAQSTLGEASITLENLVRLDAAKRAPNKSHAYLLSAKALAALRGRASYRLRTSIAEHQKLIDEYLASHDDIGTEEASALLDVSRVRASQILGELRDTKVLESDQERGRGVRYRRIAGRDTR